MVVVVVLVPQVSAAERSTAFSCPSVLDGVFSHQARSAAVAVRHLQPLLLRLLLPQPPALPCSRGSRRGRSAVDHCSLLQLDLCSGHSHVTSFSSDRSSSAC